ncbi:GNAT family N-acetyltransferase [Lacicoccus alkaliphilus]|uniref:Ribosomal protein S18 acetylase RimI n=1 Tax=Lacicoccus alkaliphilus DSM 16010 TaxID=1123231 RepID=A0A1M7JTT4_9BACL|nr:GNAT family N-acetyltransferase [Salinicoccus alkaliphilus]SHM56325.1 Ribosomal protein S18 acetylase RimI [Salinicoccus alkaliphilus DSM 16010]
MDFRFATADDLKDIVAMLADDELGKTRETVSETVEDKYLGSFKDIEAQTGNQILLSTENGTITGCLQLTFIPTLARGGMKRAQIEGVRVHKDHQKKGIGRALFEEAIRLSKEHGCGLVQLTTDKRRSGAHAFYHKLGFEVTHEGMKRFL